MKDRGLRIILPLMVVLAIGAGDRKLTDADWAQLKQGKIISEVKNEGGTQSAAWSVGWFPQSPETVFKAIAALDLYDETTERLTVSVLVDETTKDKILKNKINDPDQIEKLFAAMPKNWRKDLGGGKYLIYSYQRNDLPWPANDRWIIIEMINDPVALTQSWKRLCGNIKTDWGNWKVSAAPGGGARADLEIHLDLDLAATGPFTAFAMEITIPDTYSGLKKIMAIQARKK